MKRTVLSLLFFLAAGMVPLAAIAFAEDPIPLDQPLHGYYTYGQLQGATTEEVIRGDAAATTIPMGAYTVTSSRDGNQYQGVFVGRSPLNHGSRTTTIPAFIVPIKIKTSDGHVFDPSATDSTCLSSKVPLTVFKNSPLFQPVAFTMNGVSVGTTQYSDAFERAEFWQNVSVTGDRFHTMISPTPLPEQTLTLTSGQGGDFTTGGCGHLAIIDFQTLDTFVQNTIVPFVSSHGGGPTSFPIILLYNVVMATPFVSGKGGPGPCCVLGYHNVFSNPVQTYGVMDFDSTGAFNGTKDISPSSHEIDEWVNDPLGNNATPGWTGGQVTTSQCNFEVGDPLSGTLFPSVTVSGFTYHPQELAFFSWFYGAPSIGTGSGDFSDNDTFTSDAGAPLSCF